MTKLRKAAGLTAVAVSTLLGAHAEAGNNRSVVSTTGLDTNNCSVPAPCRSFAAALLQTNPKGEIIVLDSGGYGPATITQPVTITAPVGIRASVFTATVINGLTINTTGNVTISGISFLGGGVGTAGIEVMNVGTLYLDSVQVQDFTGAGIISFAGNLFVSNTIVKNCNGDGLTLNVGSNYVRGSTFVNNAGDGVRLFNGNAVLVDSVASLNGVNGAEANNGILRLLRFETVFNGSSGIAASAMATVGFDYALSTRNVNGAFANGGIMSGSNPGTNLLDGGGNGTTLSTAIGLQ